jgi:hypothetical protein
MRRATLVILACVGVAVALTGQASAGDLTLKELTGILQIHAWHVPQPGDSKQWTIEVIAPATKTGPKTLPTGSALISVRPSAADGYAFTLADKRGESSGTFRPCAEPKELPSLCEDGYSISFEDSPICIGDCSRAIVGKISAMLDPSNKRWIIISKVERLVVPVNSDSHVTPVR